MKKRGYLLLEMVFAFAFISTSYFIIAALQAQIACWHRQAEQYLIATTLAQRILSELQRGQKASLAPDGFTATIEEVTLEPSSLFTLATITVTFKTPHGKEQNVVIDG